MPRRYHLRESSSSGSDPPSPFQTTPPREIEYHEIKISTNQFGAWLLLESGIGGHFIYTRPGDVFVVMNDNPDDPKHYIVKVVKRGISTLTWPRPFIRWMSLWPPLHGHQCWGDHQRRLVKTYQRRCQNSFPTG